MKSIAIAAGLSDRPGDGKLQVAAQAAEDAVGVWLNPENQSNVEFYRCGEGLCGKITKLATGGQKTDDKNPDADKRGRPIVGLVIMEGAKKAGPTKWSGNALQSRPTARPIPAASPSRPRTRSSCRDAWPSSCAARPPGRA